MWESNQWQYCPLYGLGYVSVPQLRLCRDESNRPKTGETKCLIMANSVYQQKRGSQLSVQFSWDGIHHACQMDDGEKPDGERHLFFGEISAGHVHHGFPVRFDQTVCRLTTSRSSHHVGIVVDEVVPNALLEQLYHNLTGSTNHRIRRMNQTGDIIT
jgi:hypothetical protein